MLNRFNYHKVLHDKPIVEIKYSLTLGRDVTFDINERLWFGERFVYKWNKHTFSEKNVL